MDYDPMTGPDPEEWLELDESERMDAVLQHHEDIGLQAGSLRGHAIIHAVVEAQLAEGLESAVAALQRLQGEGLDRHETVHAIGAVLSGHLFKAARGDADFDRESYDRELASLTAASWRARGD